MNLISGLDRRGPFSTRTALKYSTVLLAVAFALASLSLLFFNISGLVRSTFTLPMAYATYAGAFAVLFVFSMWMLLEGIRFRAPTNWLIPGFLLFLFFLLMGVGGYFVAAAYQRIPSEIGYASAMYLYSGITVVTGILFLAASILRSTRGVKLKAAGTITAIIATILAYSSMAYHPAKLFTVDPTIVAFLNMEYAPAGFFFFGFFGSYGSLGLTAIILGLLIVLMRDMVSIRKIESFMSTVKRMDSLTLIPAIFYSVGALISGISVLVMPLFNDLSLLGSVNGGLTPIGSTNASLAAFKTGQIFGMIAGSALILTGALLLTGTLFITMEVVKQMSHASPEVAE